ncbi:hypothetical protein ACFXPJ_26310, partial [Streptomyces goshikiensis]
MEQIADWDFSKAGLTGTCDDIPITSTYPQPRALRGLTVTSATVTGEGTGDRRRQRWETVSHGRASTIHSRREA